MAETPELAQLHAEADPATLAFEALREEVALVRRAVAGLAAERASIEIPDYSETLGQIMRASAATARSVKALAEMPGLRLSAEDWSHEITAAAQNARHSDQQAIAQAQHEFERMAAEMAAHLRSARSAERTPVAHLHHSRRHCRRNAPTGDHRRSGRPRHARKLALARAHGGEHSRHGRGNCRRASYQDRLAELLARHRRRLPNYQRQSRCNRPMRTKRDKNGRRVSLFH